MMNWSGRRTAIQLVLMFACFAVANFFKSQAIALVWIVVALGLGIYWEIRDRAAQRDDVSPSSVPPKPGGRGRMFARFVVPAAVGTVAAILVAAADLSVTRSIGITMSLLGVPYLVPIGAIAWGAMAASGYAIGLKLVGRRPDAIDCYFMLGLALLTMVLIKGGSVYNPGLQVDVKVLSVLIGPTPSPQITLAVQAVGFALGGAIAFLRTRPASKP